MLLEAIFKDIMPSERILVFCPEPFTRTLVASVEEALAWAAQICGVHGDAYYAPSPRSHKDIETVTRSTVLWSDLDLKDFPEGLEKIQKSTAVPPTFEVSSGHGFHYYWLLKTYVDPDRAKELMKALWGAYGGGGGGRVYNAKWLLRFPGTVNYKEPGKPVPVVMHASRPNVVYAPADLLALASLSVTNAKKLWTSGEQDSKSRSEKDFHVVRELLRAGVSDDCIHMLYNELPVGDRYQERGGDSYLDRTIDNAKAKGVTATVDFLEKGDALFLKTSRGTIPVATFVFRPRKLIKVEGDNEEDQLLGDVISHGYTWEDVMLPKSAFNGVNTLSKHLRVASWHWIAGDKEVRQWLPYLMEQLYTAGLPHTRGTSVVGRHRDVWVAPHCTFSEATVYNGNDSPYVLLPTGRETPNVTYSFPEVEEYRSLVRQVSELLPQINEPDVLVPLVGWFFSTPIKAILKEVGERFPVLNIYGTQGSGKSSTILRVFQPLMGWKDPRAYPALSKLFVTLSLMACTNTVPIAFGEFRDSATRSHEEFLDLVRRAYDIGRDSRGRPDQTTQVYDLTAPFSVDGEDAFSDPAVRERSVIVSMGLDACKEGTSSYKAFQALIQIPLHDFAGRYVQGTLKETPESVQLRFNAAFADLQVRLPAPMPDRVRRNLAVIQCGLQLYNEHVTRYGGKVLPESRRIWESILESTMLSLASGRSRIVADDLVEDVISYARQVPAVPAFYMQYDSEHNILWFHLSGALGWWAAKRRREGRTLLQVQAMRAQLVELQRSYVLPEAYMGTGVQIQRCVGVDVAKAEASGLDVPRRLRPFVEINVQVQEGE